ncbi:hypothetical protein CQW23_10122 [Capsicum baccatum]|uniref:Uncharacterized protein n=1 Tax=Capsicum baccatum TaxID=33114 RepID=A0A2G2WYT2_CAPBA|nr:hypothetical protein CQW23_10122 [Capsicum baccatum]
MSNAISRPTIKAWYSTVLLEHVSPKTNENYKINFSGDINTMLAPAPYRHADASKSIVQGRSSLVNSTSSSENSSETSHSAVESAIKSLTFGETGESVELLGSPKLDLVWAWERIVPLQPLPLLPSEENLKVLTAHARKWSCGRTHQNEARSVLVIIRDVLDNLTENQCRPGCAIWMAEVQLICGIHREWHMIDRVIR